MTETTQFIARHGLSIVFAAVLVEQIGLPLPAMPWLLAAGALAADGQFNLPLGITASVAACLMADALWFYLGRRRGSQVLGFLCRISLEPDSCVRRTGNIFTRYGWRGLVVSKFVPGMSTITPPLAGLIGVRARRFFTFDALGSLLYCGLFTLLGFFFSNQITRIGAAIAHIGGSALAVLVAFLAAYVGFKYWQRQRLLHELRMARITVAELHQKLEGGEKVLILDVRTPVELQLDPSIIRGAIHLGLSDLAQRQQEFPRDRDIIIYCSCPNEVTSARAALLLRRKGFTRIHPLLGGWEAWRKNDYPIQVWTATVTATAAPPTTSGPEPAGAQRPLTEPGHQETA